MQLKKDSGSLAGGPGYCLRHAASTISGNTLGEKKGAQFLVLILQLTLLQAQGLCRCSYFVGLEDNSML
ncbi:hypothetical protein Pyn_07603 [Prunus yedoensis var. nudiflora]|uniref:Uncharacterized protein n=1 Tax=Prunus yedoensis var. nudiflora TaxID=2094558 RepID=A0A314XHS4_PRUYE|nr:hypothetical protein Pyn_07603 [Prunus yedoensis var. nudiflora]